MGDVFEIIALALLAMFFPALLAVVLIALRSSRPQLLLASFFAGGFLAANTVGLVIVFSLQDASVDSTSSNGLDPIFYVVLGILSLIAAWVVRDRQLLVKKEPSAEEAGNDGKPDRLTRALDRGAPYALVAGLLLCAVPGFSALVGLKDIAQLGWSTSATVAMVIVFFLIMFAFIELPLVGFLIAPEQATVKTLAFNSWLDRNANRLATGVLVLVGVLLIVRGVVQLF
jgi:hypothetical protein